MVKNKGRKTKPTGKNNRPPQGQRPNNSHYQRQGPPQGGHTANRRSPYPPQSDERRRQAIKRKKLKKRRKIFLYLSFLFITILTLVILCFTVFFKVQSFTVSGRSMYDKDTIIRASGIKLNDNMLLVGKKKTVEKICTSLPYIGEAKISYRLPDTIKITVSGTNDKMVYRDGKNFIITNENGKVLSICPKVNDPNLLEVRGVKVKKAEIGYPIELEDAKSSQNLKLISDAFKKNNIKDINYIDLKDKSNIKAMYQNRIEIWLGPCSNLDKKMLFVNKVLEKENERSLNQRGVIDLQYLKTGENENQKVYFRPQDAKEEVQITAPTEDDTTEQQSQTSENTQPQ